MKIIAVMHVFLRSNERKAWKIRDSKGTQAHNLCVAESANRPRIVRREQKNGVLQKGKCKFVQSTYTLFFFLLRSSKVVYYVIK